MSRDNWERLVVAVLKRDQIWQLCHQHSSVSTISSGDFSQEFLNFSEDTVSPVEINPSVSQVKRIFAKPIQLAYQVIKATEEVTLLKQYFDEVKSKTEKLTALLRKAEHASNDFCELPTRRIINETEAVLDKALGLVLKCRGNRIMKRVLIIIPTAAFRKILHNLNDSIGNVSWLLGVYDRGYGYLGLPPIAANVPIIGLIWEQIAILYTGSVDDKVSAAASLVSLARDNDYFRKLIIEEGGVLPLLKLVKEGNIEGQENAARAIGLLGKDSESVEHMIHAGVCNVFAEMLTEGPMKVQAVVAWAVSELAEHYPKCQDLFAQHSVIQLLVHHLLSETLEEHSKYASVSEATSSHQEVFLASNNRALEMQDPGTEAYVKEMSARALCKLAKGNPAICRSLTESRALLCFASHLEKGPHEVRLISAMALMEITAVAEEVTDLRRSAFQPNSLACKVVVHQLLKIIEKEDVELLIPCIKAIGNLASTFTATESRIINPLVKLLDEREAEVSKEACIALTKFACSDNYLCVDHCKAIIAAGGEKHLVQLAYFG